MVEAVTTMSYDAGSRVAEELRTIGRLCADIVTTFWMAETMLSEVSLTLDCVNAKGGSAVATALPVYWERKQHESARFRDAIAVLSIDAVFGYCLALRRALQGLATGKPVDLDAVRESLLHGCRRGALTELLERPPRVAVEGSATGYRERQLASAYQAARVVLLAAREVAEAEQVETLGELVAEGRTEAGEAVLDCLTPVSRYAETLQSVLQRRDRPFHC